MVHVMFVGDSFSDDGRRSDTLDIFELKKSLNYYNIGFPNAIKSSSFLALDVLNQNLENIKKLANKEGINMSDLIKILKKGE